MRLHVTNNESTEHTVNVVSTLEHFLIRIGVTLAVPNNQARDEAVGGRINPTGEINDVDSTLN